MSIRPLLDGIEWKAGFISASPAAIVTVNGKENDGKTVARCQAEVL
jgi:hypothetical protein